MQVTTLSFYRLDAFWHRVWAFLHMGLAPSKMRRVPDIGFFKLLGTGRGAGFHPAPNFHVYSILATWPSREAALRGLEDAAFRAYADKATETWHLLLSAVQGHGSWDRQAPFECERTAASPRPIGVLTRASIRWTRLLRFWQSVPSVSATTRDEKHMRFRIGMGERPILQLMTFSLWDDVDALKSFAYRDGQHLTTLRRARAEGWFSEELFARFRVIESRGTWGGRDPLADVDARPLSEAGVSEAAE